MILRNSKGRERNFKILFKIEHENNTYIVYEDYMTGKCYVGCIKDGNLNKLPKEEIDFVLKILEKVNEE